MFLGIHCFFHFSSHNLVIHIIPLLIKKAPYYDACHNRRNIKNFFVSVNYTAFPLESKCIKQQIKCYYFTFWYIINFKLKKLRLYTEVFSLFRFIFFTILSYFFIFYQPFISLQKINFPRIHIIIFFFYGFILSSNSY